MREPTGISVVTLLATAKTVAATAPASVQTMAYAFTRTPTAARSGKRRARRPSCKRVPRAHCHPDCSQTASLSAKARHWTCTRGPFSWVRR